MKTVPISHSRGQRLWALVIGVAIAMTPATPLVAATGATGATDTSPPPSSSTFARGAAVRHEASTPDLLAQWRATRPQVLRALPPATFETVDEALTHADSPGVDRILTVRRERPEAFASGVREAFARGWKPTSHIEAVRVDPRSWRGPSSDAAAGAGGEPRIILAQQSFEDAWVSDGYVWAWEWNDGDASNWEGQLHLDNYTTGEEFHFNLQVQPQSDTETTTPWMSLLHYGAGTAYANTAECPSRERTRRVCVATCMRDKIRKANWMVLVGMGSSAIGCLSRLSIFVANAPYYFACFGVGSMVATAAALLTVFSYDSECYGQCDNGRCAGA